MPWLINFFHVYEHLKNIIYDFLKSHFLWWKRNASLFQMRKKRLVRPGDSINNIFSKLLKNTCIKCTLSKRYFLNHFTYHFTSLHLILTKNLCSRYSLCTAISNMGNLRKKRLSSLNNCAGVRNRTGTESKSMLFPLHHSFFHW